jgi:hypothetical protein
MQQPTRQKILYTLMALAVVAAGCTTVQVHQAPEPTSYIRTTPLLNQQTQANVGATVLSQHREITRRGLRLASGFSGRVGGAPVNVTPQDLLLRATANSQQALCTERLTMSNLVGVPIKPTCFGGLVGDAEATTVMVPADAMWWSQTLPSPLKIETTEIPVPQRDVLRRELVYLGTTTSARFAGTVIRIGYREFLDDIARPAFSQEASYDVTSLPARIAYQNASIEVLAVGAGSMTYRVLSAL